MSCAGRGQLPTHRSCLHHPGGQITPVQLRVPCCSLQVGSALAPAAVSGRGPGQQTLRRPELAPLQSAQCLPYLARQTASVGQTMTAFLLSAQLSSGHWR